MIFIDELDAVGGARSGGGGDGGTSEREQALNQLLVELDGFERDPGTVIVIAASNYVDKLDQALLRPGRFDRQVLVAPPDRDGREAILRAHAKGKPLGPDLDLTDVARKTTGMTGAQLANALNEAAIIAGRAGRKAMAREDLDEALLRQSVGSQQARRLNQKERRIVAYHEAGHALCRRLLGLDPPEILSIVPRGPALGFVGHSPQEDTYLKSRDELLDEIVTLLGGRAAEEEVFGDVLLGRRRRPRPRARGLQADGRRIRHGRRARRRRARRRSRCRPATTRVSDRTRRDVDLAAMTLAREAYRRARALLAANRECLDDLAANALERETLTREDLDEIFAAHELHDRRRALGHARARRGRRCSRGGRRRRVASSVTMTDARRRRDYYFPPGRSMARTVHGERAVGLLYGQRALLIGALEPLTYTGTMLSTRAGDQPFQRLARTAKIQETVFLGTREEADKALAAVHRLHERIKGELPEAAGAHPAGTPYSAFDPELMLWTLAVIADSGRAMYETMVRPLSDGRARGPLAGLRPLRRALRPAAQRGPGQLPRVQRLVGGAARLARPARDRARAGDGAAGRLRAAGAAARRAATSPPRTTSSRARCRRGCGRSSASAGAAPTRPPSGRWPPPTAAPAASSRARCAAAATTSSSTSSAAPSSSAAARARRSSTPAPRNHRLAAWLYPATWQGRMKVPAQEGAVLEGELARGPAGGRFRSGR